MDETLDFHPTATAMARVLAGIRDDQLGGPTPCPAYTVADLAEHVTGLTAAFTHAASRTPLDPSLLRDGDGAQLPDGWRERTAADLAGLADAWDDPAAYEGTTMAGPVEMPGREAGLVALDELVVHGWDLARATGQEWAPDAAAVAACAEFVASFDAPANEDGGLFGPPVAVGDDASDLDRLVGLTGRDPRWTPRHHRH
ncbi:TIGR03086 family metal-binding protein [Nocardioides lentus]|uniref:TIGR03086 family metal-binding protein n=1 Tax=Nocardioides lentus TaxID=338077 RepID=A0ABP5A637_9ACTN